MPAPPASGGNDKALIILCHLSALIGVGFILPLIVYLVKRTESDLVAAHAREVLNFHLSLLIYALCTLPFVFILIGIPVLFAIGLTGLICAILGAVRASEDGFFHYPITLRMIP
jgi:uncharacterized protein